LKLEALDHPKTLDLAARLEVELPTAIGYLELLWAFTGKKAPQGNIGKWPDGAIARACYWMGRPETFLLALQESGFIDADDQHRFTVHDWQEHCPRWVKSKLATLKLGFARDTSGDTSPDTPHDTSGDSKGREDKTREKSGADAPPLLAGLDAEAWNRWLDYRRKIRKPLKSVSMPDAMEEMAALGAGQMAAVKHSIAKGWQGLFPPKTAFGKATPDDKARAAELEKRQFENLKSRATNVGFRMPLENEDLIGYRTLVERAENAVPRGTQPIAKLLAGVSK